MKRAPTLGPVTARALRALHTIEVFKLAGVQPSIADVASALTMTIKSTFQVLKGLRLRGAIAWTENRASETLTITRIGRQLVEDFDLAPPTRAVAAQAQWLRARAARLAEHADAIERAERAL